MCVVLSWSREGESGRRSGLRRRLVACGTAAPPHASRRCGLLLLLQLLLLPAFVQAEESSVEWRQPRAGDTAADRDGMVAAAAVTGAATVAQDAPAAVASLGRPLAGATPSAGLGGTAEAAARKAESFTSPIPAQVEPVEYERQAAPVGGYGYSGVPGTSLAEREAALAARAGAEPPAMHVDDATTAIGFVDARSNAMSLAYDRVLPGAGGVTIQSRLQFAYQPGGGPGHPIFGDQLLDASAAGVAVRLYSAQPTRLAGVYPFVEADWWQNSRTQTINVNGTKVDADLLRGLFSVNVGAHGNTVSGMNLWLKVKAGHSGGATVGARYRW